VTSEFAGDDRPGVLGSLKAVEIRSASDQVTNQILELIRLRAIKPGDRLPAETQLAERLRVGRSTIREAKRALLARGFLEARGKRGTFVAAPSTDALDLDMLAQVLSDKAMRDIYEARKIVEVGAARLAAVRATPKDTAALEETLAGMSNSIDNDTAFWPYTVEFHRRLVEASHNQALTSLAQVISRLVTAHQMPVYRTVEEKGHALRTHLRLMKAVLGGDAALAGAAMARHLDESERTRRRAFPRATR
jgi:GntR family transcriptional repressor for pyruvate dehydrogenase complex